MTPPFRNRNPLADTIINLKSKINPSSIPKEIIALYLYGSAIAGRLRKESDIDIAILISHNTTTEAKIGLMAIIESIFSKLLRRGNGLREISIVDLRGKFIPVTLQYKIITNGVLLYEKDAIERFEFENSVKSEYFDFVPYLRFLRKKKYGNIHSKA
jgi:predicted nucleotidyltransferase